MDVSSSLVQGMATPRFTRREPNPPIRVRGSPGRLSPQAETKIQERRMVPVPPVDKLTTNSQYLSPCSFFEFDGINLNPSTNPPNSNCPTFVGRMMVLPTGEAVWAREDDSGIYAFTETGQPQDSFRPVITSAPSIITPGTTIQLSGTQFNGLSQA